MENQNDHSSFNTPQCDIGRGVSCASVPLLGSGDWENPTLARISAFSAYINGTDLVLSWATATEVGTAGFNIYRVDPQMGSRTKVNNTIIPGLIESPQGGRYYVIDKGATAGEELTYVLEEIENRGSIKTYGPYTVLGKKPIDDAAIANSLAESGYARIGRASTRSPSASKAPAARTSTQQIGLSRGMKIGVKEPGLYRVDAADIAKNMNLPSMIVRGMIAANNFQLSNRGQPASVKAAADNKALYFYGEAIDSIYTDTNVYVLTAGRGMSIPTIRQSSAVPDGAGDSFTDTLHIEKDLNFAPVLFDDPEADYWFWDYMVAGNPSLETKSFVFWADGALGPGQLAVNLLGLTSSGIMGEHRAQVHLNGTFIGDTHWTGSTAYTAVFSIPNGVLLDGDNTATVTAVLDAGIPQSLFAVDSFDLTYERAYRAYGDQLLLLGDGNPDVTVDGFSSKNIWVLDLAHPQHPSLVGKATTGGSPGNYWVQFTPASPDRPYLAAALSGAKKPSSLEPVPLIGLKTGARGADYLIITAPELSKAASELASLRSRKGLKTAVVTVDQIYDDFSSSIVNPHAITAFLKHASTVWKPAPRFVLLAGDGSIDYKNVRGLSDCIVPTVMTRTPYGLVVADGLLADVKGDDGIPDLAIGRIPTSTAGELSNYVNKLRRYEASSGDWTKKILLVADNPDKAGDFAADSEALIPLLPAGLLFERMYLGPLTVAEVKSGLLNGLRSGALFVNYFGHAGYDHLAHESIFSTSDVPTLSNADRLPVFAAMTCLAGDFGLPGFDGLGETLVRKADGGAIAVWAPTSLVENADSMQIDKGFWQRIRTAQGHTLGEAILGTLQSYGESGGAPYMAHTFTLLGDPALEPKR